MEEPDESKIRMELVKMAREILIEEYINKRADDHNAWLAASAVAWKNGRMKIQYPPFVKYPTDADIVNKALTLYNFVKPLDNLINDTETSPITEPGPEQKDTNLELKSKFLPGWVRRSKGV